MLYNPQDPRVTWIREHLGNFQIKHLFPRGGVQAACSGADDELRQSLSATRLESQRYRNPSARPVVTSKA